MNDEIDFQDPLFQERPELFIEEVFGESLWEKQVEIIYSVRDNRQTTVRSSHGVGKSFIAGRVVPWFLYTHEDSKVITTAPSYRQVEDILWREIRKAKNRATFDLPGRLTTVKLELGDDWFAMGLSTDEPDRFQGFHATYLLLLVDEAAGVKEEIFEAAEGTVSSANARTLLIGNPTAVGGTFYKSFKPNSGYHNIHISAFDTPNFTSFNIQLKDIQDGSWEEKIGNKEMPRPYLVTPYWVADKIQKWGEGTPMWDSRVLGKVPEEGEDTLIPLKYIEQAIERGFDYKINDEDPENIGADIARMGGDKIVFIYRKGGLVLAIRVFKKMELMETSDRLMMFALDHPNASVSIDAVGVGAGVADRLPQLIDPMRVVPVNVGESPRDKELFANLRAELYWGLRQRFIDGDIAFDPNMEGKEYLEELAGQLSSIKFKFTPRQQIIIESKEDMKKRGLSSPDLADGLVLGYGVVGAISFAALTFGKATRPSLQETTQLPQNVDLTDEEKRKKLELEEDLRLMKEAEKQSSGGW